ncbi:MAG: response regulator [Proteobacteria bacterium]|nr:MAG: response regulator [Pseudomonadota bacterium]
MTKKKEDFKVLVVDDEPELLNSMQLSLEDFYTIIASSAEEALNLLKTESPFLIISDLRMPGMNGFDFCEKIRENHSNIPFVLVTGAADRDVAIRGLRAGLTDLLEKPMQHQTLISMVQKHYDLAIKEQQRYLEESRALLSTFLEEARDLMSDFEASILSLEEHPGDRASIDRFFRKLHTVKGSAASVQGGEKLSKLAHAMENILSLLKEGKFTVTSQLVSHFLDCNDLIGKYLDALEEARPLPDLTGAMSLVEQLRENPGLKSELPINAQISQAKGQQDAPTTEDEGVLVSADKLDRFMDIAGTLVAFKNGFDGFVRYVAQGGQINLAGLENMNRTIMKISDNVQSQIIDVRKVSLAKTFAKFPRVVRQAAAELSKQIKLEIIGQELAVDKTIAKALGASLIHAVRNSCDHGIEPPELRKSLGKSALGVIHIAAFQIGKTISIVVKDDGAGLNRDRIVAKAVERGLIDKAKTEKLTDEEAFELLFLPGFSTAEKVSSLSGRGVGMDVIKTTAVNLGGTAKLTSVMGEGMTLSVSIPILTTVMVEKSLLVESRSILIALPLTSVTEIKPLTASELTYIQNRWTIDFRGVTVDVVDYRDILELNENDSDRSQGSQGSLIVFISHRSRLLGVIVDNVLDQFEAVIRPFDSIIGVVKGFVGTALMPSNELAFVLSAEDIINRSETRARAYQEMERRV